MRNKGFGIGADVSNRMLEKKPSRAVIFYALLA